MWVNWGQDPTWQAPTLQLRFTRPTRALGATCLCTLGRGKMLAVTPTQHRGRYGRQFSGA